MKPVLSGLPYLSLQEIQQTYPLNESQILRFVENKELELLVFIKYLDIQPSYHPSELPTDSRESGCYLAIPPELTRELIKTGIISNGPYAFFIPSIRLSVDEQSFFSGIIGDIPKPGDMVRPAHATPIQIICRDDIFVYQDAVKKLCPNTSFLNSTLSEAAKVESTKEQHKKKKISAEPAKSFSVPNGTEWRDIRIHFINEKNVKVSIGNKIRERNFKTLGFAHKTSEKPKNGWKLLLVMAVEKGNLPYNVNNKKKISDLGKTLTQIFPGVPGRPFRRYAKGVGWQPLISLTLQEKFADNYRR